MYHNTKSQQMLCNCYQTDIGRQQALTSRIDSVQYKQYQMNIRQQQDPRIRICSCFSIVLIVVILTLNFIEVSQLYDLNSQITKTSDSQNLKCFNFCDAYQIQIMGICCDSFAGTNCISKAECIKSKIQALQQQKNSVVKLIWIYSAISIVVTVMYIACICKFCKKRRNSHLNPMYYFNYLNIHPNSAQEREDLLNRSMNTKYESFIYSNADNYCCICIEEFKDEKAIKLNCGHIFHSVCIREWASKKQNCPICRSKQ